MADITVSADVHSMLQAANDAAILTAIGAAPTESPTFTGTVTIPTLTSTSATADTLAFSRTLGTDHTFHGTTITGINAGATIAQFEAVYYDFTAGEWLLADANGTNTHPADGIALAAGTDGNALTVLTQGFVRDDTWNWSAGPIYLSGTAGALTQTAPSTSGDKVQIVGKAISADVALFKFDPTYVQVA